MAQAEGAQTEEMSQQEKQLQQLFKALSTGFQKLDKSKDPGKQAKQLEDLTSKMRECKRLIKDFDREIKLEEANNPESVTKALNDRKQALIKELNSYVALRKTYTSTINNKAALLDGAGGPDVGPDDGPQKASTMSNQELIERGNATMDETDRAIDRGRRIVEDTINIGAQTGVTLKGQTEQMGRIVNDLDTIHFSIKKAANLLKEISRQIATDRCIMFFLFIIFLGVIAIIIVKVVNPHNKNIRPIPGLTPPGSRKLLMYSPYPPTWR
eukprot:TRINITY_DN4387_c0_g2_i1.p1 TRINITY_DN4387_c0_g2~~TRINITY_DN4387_c0_g2_i1.p1  ORF type:complete len:269 (+),score=60.01 TRINITY_DN4387_c0_g2_i1:307-1113(+)